MIVTDPKLTQTHQFDGAEFTLGPLSASDRVVLGALAGPQGETPDPVAHRRATLEALIETVRRGLRGWKGVAFADGRQIEFEAEPGRVCASRASVDVLPLAAISFLFDKVLAFSATPQDVGKS